MIKTMSQRFSQHFMAFMAKLTSKYSIYLILIAMLIICSILSPAFFSAKNLSNISRQISITTIISFGMTMLIISGMIDLAAGSVMALAGILAVACYKATGSLLISMLAGIVIGIACNIVSGFIVTRFKTPPFIATLAMMTSARGAALMYTNGQNIYPEEIEDKLNNMYLVLESLILDSGNGKLKAMVVPDYEQAEAEGVDKNDLPQIMQNNLTELNSLLAAYERVSEIIIYPTEFEKTPKRSIKRYLYSPSLLNK